MFDHDADRARNAGLSLFAGIPVAREPEQSAPETDPRLQYLTADEIAAIDRAREASRAALADHRARRQECADQLARTRGGVTFLDPRYLDPRYSDSEPRANPLLKPLVPIGVLLDPNGTLKGWLSGVVSETTSVPVPVGLISTRPRKDTLNGDFGAMKWLSLAPGHINYVEDEPAPGSVIDMDGQAS